jgi:DNA processing protein
VDVDVQRERRLAALGLAFLCHAGGHSLLKLLGRKNPEEIWSAPREALLAWGMRPQSAVHFYRARNALVREDLERELAAAGLWFVGFGTPDYPPELAHLSHPPAGLFVRGDAKMLRTLLTCPRVTIVGTRKATAYGTRAARDFAAAFAGRGVAVVSGMALGIDGRAHAAALEVGGMTAAVLGCGADVIYPVRHTDLYRRVAASGLILSELPPGAPPSRWTFPNRNRLLAALGDAVLVVEGSATSGALQTADQAAELGRPVFAVPGSIYIDSSRGTNLLARDGASLALQPTTAVEEFLLQTRIERGDRQLPEGVRCTVPPATATDPFREAVASGREAILAAITEGPRTVDSLMAGTGLDARRLSAALAELELAGLAARAGPGLYIRAP